MFIIEEKGTIVVDDMTQHFIAKSEGIGWQIF